MSIVERYIPNSVVSTIPLEEKNYYLSPLPTDFKWTPEDESATADELQTLEAEFGFRLIEVAGSLNYLAHTAMEELFAIRKLCRFTRSPGRLHFEATLHLLNHIRCHPPQALKWYHDAHASPLAQFLVDSGHPKVDPTFVYYVDSSWQDCWDGRSTGALFGLLQGGIIDGSSFVPSPIALSSAEAETNAMTVCNMSATRSRMIYMELLTGNPDATFTVPILTDSQAAIAITRNEKGTAKTRHILRRDLYCRQAAAAGYVIYHHVNGDEYQLADIGTKNLPASKSATKLSIIEAAPPS